MLEHKITADYHKRMIAIKRYVYPPQMLNLLILMTAFILYGAADTGNIPMWVYQGLLLVGILQFCDAKVLQHKAFRESTFVILEMSGIKPPTLKQG
jgi:O-antigen/teichoic acid export membrane protein